MLGLKRGKAFDESGLVAALLHHVSTMLLTVLLAALCSAQPHLLHWRCSRYTAEDLLQMLPESARAKVPADYRPIASIRLLYKTNPQNNMVSARVEEHLLTASVIIDKGFACNRPIWIIRVDLPKAFGRVAWDAFWDTLKQHGAVYYNTLFWGYRNYITTTSAKFTMLQAQAVNFTSRAVSDKVAFSALDCLARFCNLRSKSGVRVLNMSALIWTTI